VKFFLPALLLFGYAAQAQQTLPQFNSSASAKDTAIEHYYKFTDQRSRLYNGKEFIAYHPAMEGHAFFTDDQFHKGTVMYDGLKFEDVNIQYDLVRDDLVIQHFDVFFKLVLVPEKVQWFVVNEHKFKRLVKDSLNKIPLATGYYDFLHEGDIELLVRRTKRIEETVTDRVTQRIAAKDFFYIHKDGVYHPVRSLKGLLSVLKENSRNIRQELRRQKIKFRKNREKAILTAVKLYDSTTN
jgi:hypothetical protein